MSLGVCAFLEICQPSHARSELLCRDRHTGSPAPDHIAAAGSGRLGVWSDGEVKVRPVAKSGSQKKKRGGAELQFFGLYELGERKASQELAREILSGGGGRGQAPIVQSRPACFSSDCCHAPDTDRRTLSRTSLPQLDARRCQSASALNARKRLAGVE